MSRVSPRQKNRVLYLGRISEPPIWLPQAAHSLIQPLLNDSGAGIFLIESPSKEEVDHLERIARESQGIIHTFKAGGYEFCVLIDAKNKLRQSIFPSCENGSKLYDEFAAATEGFRSGRFTLTLRSGKLTLGERTLIMGILNVTPDSFSDGGRFFNFDAAAAQAEKMVAEGANVLDIGGESTRPGAKAIPVEEEARRVIPLIEHLAKRSSVPISIDTCKAEIARRAMDAGAEIINDVSALRNDPELANVAARAGCPLVLMHMLGVPKIMQVNPCYDALIPEIVAFLRDRIDFALDRGVAFEQIVVDPGIGFGKTVEHNLVLMRELGRLKALGRPILIGPSRKSTIGKVLGTDVDDRIEGTAAAVAVSIMNGAHIVRVHDVKQMARVARMTDAIMQAGSKKSS